MFETLLGTTTRRPPARRPNAHRSGNHHRRMMFEPLEDRRVLSIVTPAVELFGVSPALFIENQGQWADETVRFLHPGIGANVAMTDAGVEFQVFRRELMEGAEAEQPDELAPRLPDNRLRPHDYVTEVLQFSAGFVGANTVAPVGLNQSETVFNYFIGDEENWRAEVPGYEVVAYQGLYDGIDLHTWGRRSSLKYEFQVAPGTDWSQIAVRYDGIAGLSLAEDGSLLVDLGEDWGSLSDDAPYIYQVIDGQEVEVAGRFVLIDDWTYTFDITGQYDAGRALIIDPDLAWVTYLGGTGDDRGYGIAVDAAGNALVTGSTLSADFSGANNPHNDDFAEDAFVAKFSPSGQLQWATYLGGSNWGEAYAKVRGPLFIAVDAAGNAMVSGTAYGEAFVAKVSPSGQLQWTTGLDLDEGWGIAVDAAGNALVTSIFSIESLSIVGESIYELVAIVTKFSPSGELQWDTLFGGTGDVKGYGIAVDAAGNALVTGETSSTDFSEANNTHKGGSQDAFVAKFSPSGQLQWATYLGGTGEDRGYGIAVDAAGNALVTGVTSSTDFSGANNTYKGGSQDAFVAKVSPSGQLQWATYLGGTGDDWARGIAVDATGNALVTGSTHSTDFSGANNTHKGGSQDAFVAKVSPSGQLLSATYLGGSGSDHGLGIAVDAAGNALVSGTTYSTDFSGANNSHKGGLSDAFVAKIKPPPFEVLARGIAYSKEWYESDPPQEVWFDGVNLEYTVDRIFDYNVETGFYGLGLLSARYGPALVLRGTEASTLPDLWTDLDPRGVGYSQFHDAWPSVSAWVGQLDTPADIVGHSLGGALAQWFAAALTSANQTINRVVTFNATGISDSPALYPDLQTYAHRFDPENATSVTHYIVNGDMVSMAGETFLAGDVYVGEFSVGQSGMWTMQKHSLPLTVPSVGERKRPEDLNLKYYSSVDHPDLELNSPSFSYTDREYRLWLLGMQVAGGALTLTRIGAPLGLPLMQLSPVLYYRGTTEASRALIGAGLRQVLDVPHWSENLDGSFVLTLTDQVRGPYKFLSYTVAPDFTLTSDGKTLEFEGGLSIAWRDGISIALPSWLGDPITADHLIELLGMDFNAVIDAEKLEVNGQLALFDSLGVLTGKAYLNWGKSDLSIEGSIDILGGFVTAEASTRIGASGSFEMRGEGTIQIPSSVPFFGGMQTTGDFLLNREFVAAWGPLGGRPMGLQIWFDGRWGLVGARSVELLDEQPGKREGLNAFAPLGGAALQQQAEPDAQWFLIPENREWGWFFIEWENPSEDVGFHLRTPSGQVLGEAEIEADPSMTLVTELSNKYRKVVLVEQPEAGAWQVLVDDTTGLGEVQMAAMVSEPPPEVAIVGLSGGLLREPIEIHVVASAPESEVQVALFYDTDGEGFDGVMIADGLVPDGDALIHYTWDTSDVASGEYFLYARVMDEFNPPVYAYAADAVEITDPAPVVTSLEASPDPVVRPGELTLVAEVEFDPAKDLWQVEFYRGEELLGSDYDGLDVWSLTVSTLGWQPGEYVFSARAQDIHGVWSEPVNTTVTVENAPPIIKKLTADTDTIMRGDDMTLTATGVDDSDGVVERVEFWLGEVGGDGTLLGEGVQQNGDWVLIVPGTTTLGWDLGENTLLAWAQDDDGAWSEPAGTTVMVVSPLPGVVHDLAGRVAPGGDWWMAASNGVDAFTNQRIGRWSIGVSWLDVLVGDFTGNGFDDIAGRVESNGDWWVAVNNGDGTFTNERWGRWNPNVEWFDVMVGDFNGDGKADIVGRVAANGDWWVAESTGAGFANSRWGRWSPTASWTDVMTGDFSGDGRTDIVGRVAANGDWWVAESTGSEFANGRWGRWSPTASWTDVMTGDFNGDGRTDLVGRVATNGDWWVAESTGSGFANSRWGRWSPNVEWLDVMTGDFNGDGRSDLVGRVATNGDWWVAESTGSGFANARWGRWSPNAAWTNVMTGDFNGDGRTDLVGRVATNGDWWMATSDGTGSFTNARWGRWTPNAPWGPVLVGNFAPAAAALHAAHSPASNSDLPASISQADLQPIVEEAVLRLRPELDGVVFHVQIVDLPGLMLGRTVGNTIQIDPGAAGFGWYLNPTDADFEPGGRLGELTARPGTDAVQRIDLLTAVMHEMGHLLGYDHAEQGLMQPTLALGIRRLPSHDDDARTTDWADLLDDLALEPSRLSAYFATIA